jgi:hypothetical protein
MINGQRFINVASAEIVSTLTQPNEMSDVTVNKYHSLGF